MLYRWETDGEEDEDIVVDEVEVAGVGDEGAGADVEGVEGTRVPGGVGTTTTVMVIDTIRDHADMISPTAGQDHHPADTIRLQHHLSRRIIDGKRFHQRQHHRRIKMLRLELGELTWRKQRSGEVDVLCTTYQYLL